MRANSTAHASANTTLETSTAAAAPLAPHIQPNATASGMSTTVSMPCVQIRSFGRPTVTANDFDQPTTNCTAPATTMMRAAFTAPRFFAWNSRRTICGMKTSSSGRSTTLPMSARSV